jgi:hypothetical protein
MQISDWPKDREQRGTLADVARRMLERDLPYAEIERWFRGFYMLEALLANDGDYGRAASDIGVCRHTISRALKEIGLGIKDVRAVVAHIRGGR